MARRSGVPGGPPPGHFGPAGLCPLVKQRVLRCCLNRDDEIVEVGLGAATGRIGSAAAFAVIEIEDPGRVRRSRPSVEAWVGRQEWTSRR